LTLIGLDLSPIVEGSRLRFRFPLPRRDPIITNEKASVLDERDRIAGRATAKTDPMRFIAAV